MKKFILLQTVILLSGFLISTANGQTIDYLARAYQHIQSEYGLDQKAIGNLKIKNQYLTDHNKVTHVQLVQVHDGVEIFGTSVKLAFLPDGKILSNSHRLSIMDNVSISTSKPRIDAPQAINIAAQNFGIVSRAVPQLIRFTDAGLPVFAKSDISIQDMPAELGYLYTASGEYRLSWKIQIEPRQKGDMYFSYVDALDGTHISDDKLTLHCSFEDGYLSHNDACTEDHAHSSQLLQSPLTSAAGQYRVLPLSVESPSHGSFELVTDAEDLTASPFGWHDTDGLPGNEFTITRGNNVYAFLDRNWDYAPDQDLDGGTDLIFDFPFNDLSEPSGNQNVAITNLFFWNNIMHDFSFRYGFNEVAGNFQAYNYTAQGFQGDNVEAHAQFGDDNPTMCGQQVNNDVACLNNADFSTPMDGFNGRMRMFTWDANNSNRHLDVLEPVELAGKVLTGLAQFGPDITDVPVTGEVVIADDGSSTPTLACNTLNEQPGIDGKIVLIDRGVCDFSEKVYHAQEGGAIGAIICNFEEATIGMGAANMADEVTIPSVFISYSACQRIRIAAGNGLKVSLVAPPPDGGPTKRDGSLDNSIISHEYGHGISTRMTGVGCLTPGATTGDAEESWGMGEGWSDFFALALTAKPGDTGAKKRGVGTYASKESVDGRGLRTFPYSTDMTINSHTFDDILFESIPHGVGSVWSVMLWDLYWAFSDAYGWDPDVFNGTGGNNIAIQLIMDGLKLQQCNPGFINARDAILQADQINNNGVNECLIWNVFARRGLGWDAQGGDKNKRNDGVEGFETLPTCLQELKLTKTVTPEIKAGDEIGVTLYVVNHTTTTQTNVFLEDLIPAGTSYIDGSANITPATGNSLVWSIDAIEPGEEITITYLLQSDPSNNSVRMIYDDIEGDALGRWDVLSDGDLFQDNYWFQNDIIVHSGVSAWYVGDVAEESKHWIQNYQPYHVTGDNPVYRFYHYYNTETGADGGFLEISTDGFNWERLESKIFRNGYPRRLQYGTFAIPDLYAYSGLSNEQPEMTAAYVDLSDYIGEDVYVRFKFGTDDNTPGDGWYVDDVEIMDAVIYNTAACISSDQSGQICDEAPERGTIVDSEVISSSHNEVDNSALSVNPNPAGDFVQIVYASANAGNADVRILDLNGKQLYSADWNLSVGFNQHGIQLERFIPGMYVVQINTGDAIVSKKFVKE